MQINEFFLFISLFILLLLFFILSLLLSFFFLLIFLYLYFLFHFLKFLSFGSLFSSFFFDIFLLLISSLEGETVIAVEGKICMYIGFWGKLYSSACQNHVPFTAFVMFTHIFLRNINVKKIKRHPESI